jgi:CrcB protein
LVFLFQNEHGSSGLISKKNIHMVSWIAVFVGGGLGSLVRWRISQWLPVTDNFPWATFVANVLASAILAAAAIYFSEKENQHTQQALLIMTGFCGGFSTFSTFSLETFRLMDNGRYGLALIYVLASVACCLAAMWMIYKAQGS